MSKCQDGPDKGWSWVIVIAACFTALINAGFFRISGLFLVSFIHEFNSTREEASWPLITFISVFKLSGIIGGPLAYRYGVRPIVILGSFVGSSGLVLCCFATSLSTITFFFGVVCLGCGIAHTMVPVIVNQYFLMHRVTAMGLALSGASFGALIFPVLHEYLTFNYGLKGYFLLLGGIILQSILCGALMRPPPWIKENLMKVEEIEVKKTKYLDTSVYFINGREICHLETNDKIRSLQYKQKQECQTSKNINVSDILTKNKSIAFSEDSVKQVINIKSNIEPYSNVEYNLRQNSEIVSKIAHIPSQNENRLLENFHLLENRIQTSSNLLSTQLKYCYENTANEGYKSNRSTSILQTKTDCSNNPEEHSSVNFTKDIFNGVICENLKAESTNLTKEAIQDYDENDSLSGGIKMKCRETILTKSSPSFCHRINNSKDNRDNLGNKSSETDITNTVTLQESVGSLSVIQAFKKVLVSPVFHIISIGNAGFHIIIFMYGIIIVDFAVDRGVPQEDTKYILFAVAVSDLIGRLAFGWITDKNYMRKPHYLILCMMATALVFCIYPFAHGFSMHISLSSIWGLLFGCIIVVYPVVLVEYIGKELQDIGFGFMNFFNGIILLIWPSIIGYFRDNLGSYSIMFYILGGIAVGTSVLWLFEKCFKNELNTLTYNKSDERYT